ncbi:MAG: NAD(+) synthase [Bacteroidetes bacterium]|nr:NAD(+) synthase [Bacteroidota bacterium]
MRFSPEILRIDVETQIRSIAAAIQSQVHEILRRRGAVVAVSGGIDSATCAALCTAALGKDRVLALFLPERDSSTTSLELAKQLAESLDIPCITEPVGEILQAAGCYARQDEAIKMALPEYESGWKFKITLPSLFSGDRLNVPRLTVLTNSGEVLTRRMPAHAYLQLVAATNFKQRVRTMVAYYHADRLNYAVCGTPNRLEYDQGFFVKGGDGLADFKPIAHLYKTQVYAVAGALGVPREIVRRTPTTETYSLPQTQEEFYFALPYEKLDLCLYGLNHNVPAAEVALAIDQPAENVERVYRDIETKRRTTLPLHLHSLLKEPVPELESQKSSLVQRGAKG